MGAIDVGESTAGRQRPVGMNACRFHRMFATAEEEAPLLPPHSMHAAHPLNPCIATPGLYVGDPVASLVSTSCDVHVVL